MADAAVSKTVVERRASSTLASGTILNLEKPASKEVGFFFLRAYVSARTKAYVSVRIPLRPRSRFQKEEISFLLKLVSFEGSTIST